MSCSSHCSFPTTSLSSFILTLSFNQKNEVREEAVHKPHLCFLFLQLFHMERHPFEFKKWRNHHTYMIPQLLLLLFSLQAVASKTSRSDWDGVVVTLADYQALQAIKHSFVDPRGRLRSWNDSGYGACSGNWVGIKCAQGQVIVLELPWRSLGGRISEKIGQLSALRKLSLHDNQIGGMIPTSLGLLPNLRGVQLFNNHLSGSIPPSIGTNCVLLQTLDLSNNSLNGVVPSFSIAANSSSRLYRLDLSFNALSGSIPVNLTRSPSLTILFLQHNNLSGSIPNTWGSTISRLHTLDLSSNAFTGEFPNTLCNLTSLVQLNLEGNRLGNKLPDTIGALRNLSVLDLRKNQFTGHIPKSIGKISNLTELDLSQNDLDGEIPVSLVDLAHLNSLNLSYNNLSGSVPIPLSRKFNSSSFIGNLDLCGYSISTPCPSSPPPPEIPSPRSHRRKFSTKDILLVAAGVLLAVLGLLCCILLCCCLMRRRRAASERKKNDGQTSTTSAATTSRGEKGKMPAAEGGQVEAGGEVGGKLVHFDGPFMFTADDLLCATAEIMGKSTYGTVYKATLEDGNQVAVKRLREKIAKSQKEFEKEVNLLGKIRHPNLLSLRAYYIGPKGEKLLVFDYIARGSLAAFVHARGPDTPIDWATRMNLVMGIARGLCHLHKNEDVVHGNLTSGNILLDERTNAKIADYGLFRLMTTTANSNVAATAASLGYKAPELSKLKKPNMKTDVYNLGVIMLELLTGKSPSEPTNGLDLPHWVASIVTEEWTNEVFDLELMRDASNTGDELLNTLKLALHCVDPSPAARPDVQQVLQQLEEIRPELSPGSVDDDSHTGDEAV